MQLRTLPAFLTLAICGTALAWQFDLSTLGLTPKDIDARVSGGLRDESSELQVPWLSQNAIKVARGLSEADRVAAVNAIGAAMKALVNTPAFQKAHDESVKLGHKGVNHGIKVQSQEEMMQAMRTGKPGVDPIAEMQKQMMAQTVLQLRGNPLSSLQAMHGDSLKSWTRQAQTSTNPKYKAKYQKLAAKAAEIQPLIASNPEQFKKEYTVLYSIDNDGPATDEEIVLLANKGKLEEEQRNYNKYNWKTVLKKKLQTLIAQAATVDFAAPTTEVGGKKKFVNPAFERKSALWKAMYRAGKAPTTAAAEFSKAWLKEL